MKKILLFVIIMFIIFLIVGNFLIQSEELNFENKKTGYLYIAGKKIKIEIADSVIKKRVGLSKYDFLNSDEGMLFPFINYVKPYFWMKDMKFSIDIIWIKDNKIIGFVENAIPEQKSPFTYYIPPEAINYVLEVKNGFVKQNNINIGDKVEIFIK